MKILIDMPPEFETDYVADRFAEFFDRVKADMSICCGEYEKEIADMLKRLLQRANLMLRSLPRDLTVQRTNWNGSKMCSNGGNKRSRIYGRWSRRAKRWEG